MLSQTDHNTTRAETEPSLDGRRLRSADSRRRIILAVRELIEAGNPNPGAEIVAQRAGVGLRTVFRLFRDLESLNAEVLAPQRQEFINCFMQTFSNPRGAARVLELYERLAKLFEQRMPMRRAGVMRQYDSPSLRAAMKELDDAIVAFIKHNAPPRVQEDADRLQMLYLLTSYDSWLRLRDRQGLTEAQAYALLSSNIAKQLSDEPAA